MNHPTRILLVDDDATIRGALLKVLIKEGFSVTEASSGKQAMELLGLNPFDVVITDIHMPGSYVSGIELLEYTIKIHQLPVILMTGFATMTKTQEAYDLGAKKFLAKPFRKDELIHAIREVCEIPEATAVEIDEDLNYCKLSIDDFISGKQILYNIFVRLSKSKYIKIAHQGEDIAIERIRTFKSKGIRHLYLTSADFNRYIQFNLGLNSTVQLSTKVNREKKFNFLKHTAEIILEKLHTHEISVEDFADAETIAQSSVSNLLDHESTFNLLDSLNSHADHLYAHSLGVSLYGCLIAKKLGWHSPATLYKISMAGLLHDIGKKEIDRELLSKNRSEWTKDDVRVMEKHPISGMEILSRLPNISTDVLQIVLHHHETDQGLGYPRGLAKTKIHPLARLVAVANEFCNYSVASPGCPALGPIESFHRLEMIHGTTLDGGMLNALASVLHIDMGRS